MVLESDRPQRDRGGQSVSAPLIVPASRLDPTDDHEDQDKRDVVEFEEFLVHQAKFERFETRRRSHYPPDTATDTGTPYVFNPGPY